MPTATEPRLIQSLEGAPWQIEGYLKVGGYEAWKRCIKDLQPGQVVEELKQRVLAERRMSRNAQAMISWKRLPSFVTS